MGVFDWLKKSTTAKIKPIEQNDLVSENPQQEPKQTTQTVCSATQIFINDKGDNTSRLYMHCDVPDDQFFDAVTRTGARISRISLAESHDWDDQGWYTASFNSYDAYLQDDEHRQYVCLWNAVATYNGIPIILVKQYIMLRHGLLFCYSSKDDALLSEFFEKFNALCCENTTVTDRRKTQQP